MDQVIVYSELQDPPIVSQPSCDDVAADCAAACGQAHNDWWAINDLHDTNSAVSSKNINLPLNVIHRPIFSIVNNYYMYYTTYYIKLKLIKSPSY